ncbi:uncharacterized protein LOC144099120 isoform X2 [Amblyomma americanum]
MARMFPLAALWLCATLLGRQNVQGAPRPVRQISSVDHGPYTATVHATPFMSSGVLGGVGSALGGLHSTLHGDMLGGVSGFHAPLNAASHLLSGTFGGVGHHVGSLASGGMLGGFSSLPSALSSGLNGLSGMAPAGVSVLSHTVQYGSSGDVGLAAAEHQHLSNQAHQHSLLASQALAAADAVEDAQLQATLARRHLLHKAMAHQNYAHQAQMMAHNAHQRLMQAQAAQASVMSMYHNGMNNAPYAGMPMGLPAGGMPFAGNAGYTENPLHTIIRKHCESVRYTNGGGGVYPMPYGMANGIGYGGAFPYGMSAPMGFGQGFGGYGVNGAYRSSPIFGTGSLGVAGLHGGLGSGLAGLHGGYGALGGLYNGVHEGLGYGATGLHGGLGYGTSGLGSGSVYGIGGLYHGMHSGLGHTAYDMHSGLGFGGGSLAYGGAGMFGAHHPLHAAMHTSMLRSPLIRR